MSAEKIKYAPVRRSEEEESSEGWRPTDTNRTSRAPLYVAYLIIMALTISNAYAWTRKIPSQLDRAIFSPATSAVKYKNVVGTSGVLGDNSPYQGPRTNETDSLWEDLYQFGISRIPMSEAVQLVNRTVPIGGDPGYYAITLDVFHQLHCLNMIRKRVWSQESFDEMEKGTLNTIHMDHCVDSLRQSLMCSSDITPMPYNWYAEYSAALPATAMMRTCRDFDALRDWAKERTSLLFDTDKFVEDPLGNVIHY